MNPLIDWPSHDDPDHGTKKTAIGRQCERRSYGNVYARIERADHDATSPSRTLPAEDIMKRLIAFVPIQLIAALTLACASTPESRIEKNQALFDSYPAEVQEHVRSGRIAVGYDQEMVRMALGEPDETSRGLDQEGETVIWGYTRSRPGVSIGLGGGSYGGSGGLGGGVGLGSGGRKSYTAIVEFRDGKVSKARYFDD